MFFLIEFFFASFSLLFFADIVTGTISFDMAKFDCVTQNSRCGRALGVFNCTKARKIYTFYGENSAASISGSEKHVRLHHFIYFLNGE